MFGALTLYGFRLTIRNVNQRTALNIAAGMESFRLTIRNVNLLL